MKEVRLKQIITESKEGKSSLEQVIEIGAETILSQSRHSREIKDLLNTIIANQDQINQRITNIENKFPTLYL